MTTSGLGVRTVADIVQILTRCNKAQADAAEKVICARPENVSLLMQAVGIAAHSEGRAGGALGQSIAGLGGGALGSLKGTGSQGLGAQLGAPGQAYGGTVMPGAILNSPHTEGARQLCKAALGNRGDAKSFPIQHGIAQAMGAAAMAGVGAVAGKSASGR